MPFLLGLFSLFLMGPSPGHSQTTLSDVTAASGLGEYDMPTRGFGSGAAAADFDGDGRIDLFVPTENGSPHLLYRNLGDGTFEEIAAARGITETQQGRAALWLDYDGDGRLDLLISTDCYMRIADCETFSSFLRLYRQTEAGLFVETTAAAGLTSLGRTSEEHRSGIAAADVDGDGDLDVAGGYWVSTTTPPTTVGSMEFFLNQGDGTFTESSAEVGIDDAVVSYHQPIFLDFNGDGLIDLYSSVDFTENRLWIHQGMTDGMPSFADQAPAASCDNAMNDMGVAAGDFDDDGDPDLYVSNIFREGQYNVLLRNDSATGSALCTETAQSAGVDDGGWGWGVSFADVDNNGLLDLAEVNGWRNNGWESPPRLFIRDDEPTITFTNRAATAGWTNETWGTTLLAFDSDRDGDLDFVQTHQIDEGSLQGAILFSRNELDRTGGDRGFLSIRPRKTSGNTHAIGARVTAQITTESGTRTMTRWITAGTSYLGQEPAEAFFGLADAAQVDRLTIFWPDGTQTILDNVAADQVLDVLHPAIFEDGFEAGDASAWSSAP